MLKILQITDLHIQAEQTALLHGVNTDASFREVLKQAHSRHGVFDLILVTGDLTDTPSLAGYRRILECLQNYATPTVCQPGNHDDYEMMQAILNADWVSCRKHIQLQNWQIICLNSQIPDSPNGGLEPAELSFLEHCLTADPHIPSLIAVHHPCVSSGSTWLDTMQIRNSAALLELIEQHSQVKAVCFGHVHQEMNADHCGIGIFSAPASCFQFRPHSNAFGIDDAPPGYRVFELNEDGGLNTACYWLN